MKYYENKLWCDLKNDQERVEFLLCGRAWDTNIIARAIVEDVAEAFAYRAASEFNNPNDIVRTVESNRLLSLLTSRLVIRLRNIWNKIWDSK